MVLIVNLNDIAHQSRNLTVVITSIKNWFGFRDFGLIINNKTGVIGCYEEKNSTCVSCLNGLIYDPASVSCSKCSDGYYKVNGNS